MKHLLLILTFLFYGSFVQFALCNNPEIEFNVICQDINVLLDDGGNAIIEPFDIDGGSTGNGDLVFDLNKTEFDCNDIGTNIVQLVVSDGIDLGTCDATVTVQDNTAPVAICKNSVITLDDNGNASIEVFDIENGSSDNCSIVSYTASRSEFTSANIGMNTVIMTVTDLVGNISNCISIVEVSAIPDQSAYCKDITVELDEAGNASISPAQVDNGSIGNISSRTIDNPDFDCANIGSNTVELSVSFENGNVLSCASIVTIEDNINPVIICKDIEMTISQTEQLFVAPELLIETITDNCGFSDGILTSSQLLFIADDEGDNDVELTATDNNGNSMSCTSTVTIHLVPQPSLTCPGDMVLEGNDDCIVELPDFQSQCPAISFCEEPSLLYTQEPESGTIITGITLVTMNVSDACGNVTSCSFNVTLDDFNVEIQEDNGALFTEFEANDYQWYDCGGNLIDGANSPSYTPTESGSYYISVINNNCSGNSECIEVTVSGISETLFENSLILYPNPNQGSFDLKLGTQEYQSMEISVLNELGQLVYIQNIEHQSILNISVNHLPAGIYFLSAVSDKNRATRSFVIE